MHTVHIKRRILSWVQQQPPLTGAIVAHRQLARLITLQYNPRIFLRNSYSPGLTWGHTTIHTAGGGEEGRQRILRSLSLVPGCFNFGFLSLALW